MSQLAKRQVAAVAVAQTVSAAARMGQGSDLSFCLIRHVFQSLAFTLTGHQPPIQCLYYVRADFFQIPGVHQKETEPKNRPSSTGQQHRNFYVTVSHFFFFYCIFEQLTMILIIMTYHICCRDMAGRKYPNLQAHASPT